jgi:membrane protein DedA with SNARE-associated domain
MLSSIISSLLELLLDMGYTGIFLLMFLESSFFPFPSEAVMIPAGYLSYQGHLDPIASIVSGLGGSVCGALFNYMLGRRMGRPFLYKYGKYFMITKSRLEWVERLFEKHGEAITFFGRLIPGVRQYISFPPGIAQMNLMKFLFFTAIGAGIWVSFLVYVGYALGSSTGTIYVGILAVIGMVIYYLIYRKKSVT